jgi:N-acylneuraminate cytidylyltransferase
LSHVTAFVPVRGGSKGVPGKNLVVVGGRPLVDWILMAALDASTVDRVVASTDDAAIEAHVARTFPTVDVVRRSAATASDTATTESAMLEFVERVPGTDVILLLQATSPLTRAPDIDRAAGLLEHGFDAVVSVVRQHRFQWIVDGDGTGAPVGFDPRRRPRRQDHEGVLVENGAIYATRAAALVASGCRVSGRVGVLEMPAETYVEIDEPADVPLVDALLRRRQATPPATTDLFGRAGRIRLLITDVDGCLTDNGMLYTANGDELKRFSARDGKGFELLREQGVHTMLLTSEHGPIIGRRAAKVGADAVVEASTDKLADADVVREKLGLVWEEVAFLGDDVHDVELLEHVGLSACPSDASPQARHASLYHCRLGGGRGAFREVADLILAAAG